MKTIDEWIDSAVAAGCVFMKQSDDKIAPSGVLRGPESWKETA